MEENPSAPRISPKARKRIGLALAAVALFGSGLALGMVAQSRRPPAVMAPRVATPLQRLATPASFLPAEAVTVTGRIAEKFDDLVILQDASGKAGVRLGRGARIADPLAVGTTISIQGFVGPRGLQPSFIVLPGNRVIAVGGGREHRGRHHGH